MIDIAVMGHGVVGSGVVEVIRTNSKLIEKRIGEEINIKYILDLRDFEGLAYSDRFIKDFSIIENDPSVKVVVEVMGGVNPAFDFVKRCLEKGKSVVTSNKELVARKGYALLQAAEANNANFLFEASVGGGIPVLRPMHRCLAANQMGEVLGILNGTTNFILTKMITDHMSFDDALHMAQELGYAERDPSADVDGHDACRKICILATLAFGRHVYPEQVRTEGISKITLEDVAYAADYNAVIKLIGRTKMLENGKITATVSPALVSKKSQLSSVDDVFNAVMVRGDMVGEVMFYGPGAGKLPTASAVVADVMDCILHLDTRKNLSWADGYDGYVSDPALDSTALYVRGTADNREAAVAEVLQVFPEAVILKRDNADTNEVAFVTPTGVEKELNTALDSLMQLRISAKLHTIE